MTRTLKTALLALLAGCGPGPAPAGSPEVITPLTLEPPPIYALLGYRQDLSLTSEQVTALDSIARATRERTSPLADSLQRAARRTRTGIIRLDESTAPVLERIREGHREAVEAVREVLTDEQEATTCRLFAQARRGTAPPGQPAARRPPPDSLAGAAAAARVWSWCAESPATGG